VLDVRSLLEDIAASALSERVHVELSCRPGTGVIANRDLAEQALANLVSNAVKYAPEGEIVLAGTEENGYVSLEVIDAGPGIPPEERERVLDRFYRGHENGEADGFGLGLAIASQVAEALNGKLEIDTGEAAGTRARLLLPAADA
jgi:signal transduction histidine kinase